MQQTQVFSRQAQHIKLVRRKVRRKKNNKEHINVANSSFQQAGSTYKIKDCILELQSFFNLKQKE